ncbi:c-type cytochrome [Rhodovulum sulfidophilum]|nr:c-type cytochrome [Rhodovulum sulfidophilum]OLS48205.1 cytochrome C [Rhodovulum sulfidophilum]
MSKFRNLSAAALLLTLAVPAQAGDFGLGRPALPEEIAAWDLDVAPDGKGLPEGSGSVEDGEEIFSANCAICHGEFAEGVDNYPKLAGGEDTLDRDDPVKTVGSYWPYLSTVWDYVHRSMPFGAAQVLTVDEVYAITAYILYSNYLVEDDFVLSNENFLEVAMPNTDGFIVDDRETTELPLFSKPPCMTDCKQNVEITMRAAVLDVTPDEAAAN